MVLTFFDGDEWWEEWELEDTEEHDDVVSFEGLGGTIGWGDVGTCSDLFPITPSVEDSSRVVSFKYTVLLFVFVVEWDAGGCKEIAGSWNAKLPLAVDVFLVSGLDLSTSDPSGETNGAVRARKILSQFRITLSINFQPCLSLPNTPFHGNALNLYLRTGI